MSGTAIRKIEAKFVETPIDDELALMNVDTGDFFALKETGLEIWKLIDSQRTRADICAELQTTFEIDAADCDAAVGRFLDDLAKSGLIRPA